MKHFLLGVVFLALSAPVGAEIRIRRNDDGKMVATNSSLGAYAPAPQRRVVEEAAPATVLPGNAPPEYLHRLIHEIAGEVGLPPELVRAVASVESGFDPEAVSRKGAQGLMQLMPATAMAYGVEDPHDPRGNLEGGARHLRDLLQRYRGDLSLALAAYNAGPEAVRRYGGIPPYRETQAYVKRVVALYEESRDRTHKPETLDPTGLYSYRDARGRLVMSNVAARNGSLPVRRAGLPR